MAFENKELNEQVILSLAETFLNFNLKQHFSPGCCCREHASYPFDIKSSDLLQILCSLYRVRCQS